MKLLKLYRGEKDTDRISDDEDVDTIACCSCDEEIEIPVPEETNDKNMEESSEDDEELKVLMTRKLNLVDEKQKLKNEREQRRVHRQEKKKRLRAEVQILENEVKELNMEQHGIGSRISAFSKSLPTTPRTN